MSIDPKFSALIATLNSVDAQLSSFPGLAAEQGRLESLIAEVNAYIAANGGPQASPDRAQVTIASGGQLIDAAGNVWTFGSPAASEGGDLNILKNGASAYGGFAVLMTIKLGVVYVRNSVMYGYGWWMDTGSAWSKTTRPFSFATPPLLGAAPAIPAEVAAMGYGTVTLFDDFTDPGTVDINNTWAPGTERPKTPSPFNWFVSPYFIGCTWAHPDPPWTPTPASDISIANSILAIMDDISGEGSCLLTTVDDNIPFAQRATPLPGDGSGPFYSIDPNAYRGTTFKNGSYVEFCVCFDPFLVNPSASWISLWSMPQRFLSGNDAPGQDNRDYVERDFFEAMLWINPTFAVNQWRNPRPGQNPNFQTNSNCRVYLPQIDWAQWNIIGVHWEPAGTNGGAGFKRTYINGVHIPEVEVVWTPGVEFSNGDAEPIALTIGAGAKWPVYVDWVRVTQRAASDRTVQ